MVSKTAVLLICRYFTYPFTFIKQEIEISLNKGMIPNSGTVRELNKDNQTKRVK